MSDRVADQELMDLITVAVSEYVQNSDTTVVTLPEYIVLRLHDRGFRVVNPERSKDDCDDPWVCCIHERPKDD